MVHEPEADQDGSRDVYPLVAFETLLPHGVLCGVVLNYLESPATLLEGKHQSIAFIMTPDMSRQLARALIEAADHAEMPLEGRDVH